MVFSSFMFLFVFLPVVLCVYQFVPDRYRNHVLLASSLVFYAWAGRGMSCSSRSRRW